MACCPFRSSACSSSVTSTLCNTGSCTNINGLLNKFCCHSERSEESPSAGHLAVGKRSLAVARDDRSAVGFTPRALAAVLSEEFRLPLTTPLAVGYSGGLDSHVLLHALAQLRADGGWRVRAIHIHHGLHPDADRWAEHCAHTCTALDVGLTVERVTVAGVDDYGLEEAARRARYAAFARCLHADEVLLSAHQRDDQAETVLLQLLRGTGVRGLAAMPAIGALTTGQRLARPLLRWDRAALTAYADAEGLDYIDDPSNADIRLARNYVRSEILPRLTARWPDAAEALARSARHSTEAVQLLDEVASADLVTCATSAGELRVDALTALSPARRGNLVRYWLRVHGVRVPAEATLRQILAQCEREPRTRHACISWPEAEVRRYRDVLILSARSGATVAWTASWDPAAPLLIPGTGKRLRLQAATGAGLALAWTRAAPWQVQWRRGGERCLLPGRTHRNKLKKLLQEAGVPPWERSRLPLVYVQGQLAAVADRWVCQPFAAGPGEPGVTLVFENAT